VVFILVVFLSQVFFISFFSQFVQFCFISVYHALLLFGSVSDHFGPSACNKFGFGHYNKWHGTIYVQKNLHHVIWMVKSNIHHDVVKSR